MTLLFSMALFGLVHLVLARLLSTAAQEHRLKIVAGYRTLHDQDAPQWLLDIWSSAMPALFRTGLLRKVAWRLMTGNQEYRNEMAQWLSKIHALPLEQRELHDKMDHHFAVVLAANAPYTMLLLSLRALIYRKTMKLSRVIPHRDMRVTMACPQG